MILARRSLFTLGASFLAAPSIVRASSIMPVSVAGLDVARKDIALFVFSTRFRYWLDLQTIRDDRVLVSLCPDQQTLGWARA